MLKRIIYNLIIVTSLIFFPWWITLGFIFVGFFLFHRFYEGIVAAFIMDVIYGASRVLYYDFNFIMFLLGVILFIFSDIIKKKLRFYDV